MGTPESGGGRGASGAGGAGARGAVLLAVALVLGIVLLQKFDETDGASTNVDSGPKLTTTSTRRPSVSVVPPTTSRAVRPPDQVKVVAANGTGATGYAGKVTTLLQGANYNALSPTDATRTVEATLVEYRPDFEPEARAVALLLGVPQSAVRPMEDSPPVNTTRDADVLVIAGPDVKFPGETAASTTTSTIRR